MSRGLWGKLTLLTLSQGFSMTSVNLTIISSILAASQLVDNLAYASIPFGLQYISAMITSFWVRHFIAKMGETGKKNIAMAMGQMMGVVGGLISMVALLQGSFVLFALGAIFIGMHNSVWAFIGFVATEQAPASKKAEVMSWVTAGGVMAAFLGAFLANVTKDSFAIPFAGIYGVFSMVCLVNVGVFLWVKLDHQPKKLTDKPLTYPEIFKDAHIMGGVIMVAASYMTMNFIMTASTVSMHQHHHEFSAITEAIRYHVLAMFVPSFFTGNLIKKFGMRPIIILGMLFYLASTYYHLSGISYSHHVMGLIFLGLGWNFLFVSGSVVLSQKIQPQAMIKAQALSAIATQLCQSFTSFSTGFWLDLMGWGGINIAIYGPLLLVSIMVAKNWRRY